MTDEPKESEFRRMFRERLEKEVIPGLADPKARVRSAVAVNIMAIVDRQIGKGDSEASKEWQELRDLVKNQPGGVGLVENLEAAVQKYEEDLQRQIQAGGDEARLRSSAVNVLKMAVMAKMNPPAEDGEAPAKAGEPPHKTGA
jgi:uncharacterized protein DUF6285